MTSELNLTDEGELHEEEKPRLVIGDKVPPSLHHGHKLDMNDRDPIKMNDHVKVKCKLYIFSAKYIFAPVSCMGLSTQQFRGLCEVSSVPVQAVGMLEFLLPILPFLQNLALEFWFVFFFRR